MSEYYLKNWRVNAYDLHYNELQLLEEIEF